MFTKIWQWLVLSSKDPSKVSLAIKGAGGVIISVLVAVAGITHLQVGSAELTAILDSIISIFDAMLLVVSGVVTLWGAIRKVYTSIKGTNQVSIAQDNGEL